MGPDRSVPESEALAALSAVGARIVELLPGVLPAWAEAAGSRVLGAWDPALLDGRAREALRDAGSRAGDRLARELGALLALDPAEQRSTPLEVARTAHREVTDVLGDLGVAPVVRDAFDERAFPDDDYALVPAHLGDFGDEELGRLQIAWGAARAALHRARHGDRGGAS